MSSKSLSHAKTLLVLCLLTASISGYFTKEWRTAHNALKPQITNAKSDVANATKSLASIGTLEPDEVSPVLLEDSLSAAMLALFNNRVLYGVTVASAAPERSGAGGMSKMSAIADDVPGSSLKSVKVKVSGSYQSYPDLLEYLKELQKLPVAVVHVKVTAQNFDISIRVFGTLKS